jgi:hypothetical protein
MVRVLNYDLVNESGCYRGIGYCRLERIVSAAHLFGLRQTSGNRVILAAARNIRESYDPVQLGDDPGRLDIRLVSPADMAKDSDGNTHIGDGAGR